MNSQSTAAGPGRQTGKRSNSHRQRQQSASSSRAAQPRPSEYVNDWDDIGEEDIDRSADTTDDSVSTRSDYAPTPEEHSDRRRYTKSARRNPDHRVRGSEEPQIILHVWILSQILPQLTLIIGTKSLTECFRRP